MRLEKIKLSGFKSFVDLTTVSLPSNLVAVVGPNGCGKSNVIDAVRWVMGESSARLLRGESMVDVIFNGSSNRKPVSQAGIELVFDNSDGTIGGPYANAKQIAIKRVISRDGQSTYYLNATRCRRRDITDLFLGTGLGPRSYSIIEQGTISRFIEARPEELRAFIEEAAGISKYKERRKETESSIRSTRGNLQRLGDLQQEVTKRLQHLQRQAAVAENYQTLRAEEQRLKGELLVLRWRVLEQERQVQDQHLAELATGIEARLTEQLHLEDSRETQRARQHEATAKFSQIQDLYYAVGLDIARLEQTLQFQRESHARLQDELLQLREQLAVLANQLQQHEAELGDIEATLAEQEPELVQLKLQEETKAADLERLEKSLQTLQVIWDDYHQQMAEPSQLAQAERARITHLEQQLVDIERRQMRLHEELQRLDQEPLRQEIAELEELEREQQQQTAAEQAVLEQTNARIQALRTILDQQGGKREVLRGALQDAKGRITSLEVLQKAGQNTDNQDLKQWLATQNLDSSERLLERLEVAPQWQKAVEMVLGDILYAYCTASLEQHAVGLANLPEVSLQLFVTNNNFIEPSPNSLQAHVKSPWSLENLLMGIETAVDLPTALNRRPELAPHQSIVTAQGMWLGRDWLRVAGTAPTGQGSLERAAELKVLRVRLEELEAQLGAVEAELKQQQRELATLETTRETTQKALELSNRELGYINSDLNVRRTRLEHLIQRHQAVGAEIAELNTQLIDDREAMAEAQERLHSALEAIDNIGQQRDTLSAQRNQLRELLKQTKADVKAVREQTQHRAAALEASKIEQATLISRHEQLRIQMTQGTARQTELTELLAQAVDPTDTVAAELAAHLERKSALEQELNTAKTRVEATENALRMGEQTRSHLEQTLRKQREIFEQTKAAGQELVIRVRTLEEQLKEGQHDHTQMLAALPATAEFKEWETTLARCTLRLQKLGPVNLAAIDEMREETERKDYLDSQHADISDALDTLEEAIRKIDRETKARFKDTFDKVNTGLQTLFPQLFGGGQAQLKLIGEDLLSAGISVMAHPPGKRNSSIHLLSGGEKALTAIALVFSIFQLNPAPFCMLDEVDAPLDDANVGRFCALVRSMANQVQFIFVTHNKVTMEMAKQLIGVTMHEPGVSRLVTVDIDEAVNLAAV